MSVQLPTVTRVLLTLTVSYRLYFGLAVGLVILSGVCLFLWSRGEAGGLAVDRMKLKLPVFGQTWIRFQVAQFCRTLSTLLAGRYAARYRAFHGC